jgi:hypothetical protein
MSLRPYFISLLISVTLIPGLTAAVPVAVEVDGIIRGEAEAFAAQTKTDVRTWHIVSGDETPRVMPDADPSHAATASGGAYVEILPDTRATHADQLVHGENFSGQPGLMAVLSYPIRVTTPGRYYVWIRAYSTGSEDNGVHVGLNDTWPESGQRWQTIEKDRWHWDSKQRTAEVHVGVPMQLYLDIPAAGDHTLQFSMREDGFEMDQWLLARDINFRPDTPAPDFGPPVVLEAKDFSFDGTDYYLDWRGWAAINPDRAQEATLIASVPVGNARYDVTLEAIGETVGQSSYEVSIGGRALPTFTAPLSSQRFEEGPAFSRTWKNVSINEGQQLKVTARVASTGGEHFTRAFWARLVFTPLEFDPGKVPGAASAVVPATVRSATLAPDRQPDGNAGVTVAGELKQWHAVTLDLAGPYVDEADVLPNPFTDYAFNVTFTHESGSPEYTVPGYFAADGGAAESGASAGTVWRAHLAPDKPGKWSYAVSFFHGPNAATYRGGRPLAPFHDVKGSFVVAPSDKAAPDFRARGRLAYTGERYLQFAGDGSTFFKAGPDAPETLLAYVDFDNTIDRKINVPLKTWAPHLEDWRPGDPTWHGDKGKGLIGALNYLAAKGVNSFSFLTYNAGGDGDNVWPFVERNDKFRYDVSKLAQWDIVFAHAQRLGLHLHFKLQETENDDHRAGGGRSPRVIPTAMDAGETGPERRLYLREMVARFGHHLALNWNFGEENTQTYAEQVAMFDYLASIDPYGHHRVIHTYPAQQDRVYNPLLGDQSNLTGISAQNEWNQTHARTLQWLEASAAAGRQWVVANDEQNPADFGVPPDPGYQGFDGIAGTDDRLYDLHDIRKYTLWGNLMAGGAGVEYYFGYRLIENDLNAEDFRSRDRSWDFCRIAINFLKTEQIPLTRMQNADELVGTRPGDNGNWCLAAPGELYLIYLPEGGEVILDLTGDAATFEVTWHNPRVEEVPRAGGTITGGGPTALGPAPMDATEDWAIVLRRR